MKTEELLKRIEEIQQKGLEKFKAFQEKLDLIDRPIQVGDVVHRENLRMFLMKEHPDEPSLVFGVPLDTFDAWIGTVDVVVVSAIDDAKWVARLGCGAWLLKEGQRVDVVTPEGVAAAQKWMGDWVSGKLEPSLDQIEADGDDEYWELIDETRRFVNVVDIS
jgi:hypothetical protein